MPPWLGCTPDQGHQTRVKGDETSGSLRCSQATLTQRAPKDEDYPGAAFSGCAVGPVASPGGLSEMHNWGHTQKLWGGAQQPL